MLTITQKMKRKWSEAGKQLRLLYLNTSLGAFQIAGASWVALLAARGFSLVEIGFAESVFPVSYTHLDVYKRQQWNHASLRNEPGYLRGRNAASAGSWREVSGILCRYYQNLSGKRRFHTPSESGLRGGSCRQPRRRRGSQARRHAERAE